MKKLLPLLALVILFIPHSTKAFWFPQTPTGLTASSSMIQKNLQAYFTMDGSDINYANKTMKDRSGVGTTLTYSSAFSTSTLTTPGAVGGAVYFNGANAMTSSNPFNYTQNFSWSFWVYKDPTGLDSSAIFDNEDGTAGGYYIWSRKAATGGYIAIQGNGGSTSLLVGTCNVNPSTWTHIVIAVATTSANAYVNGTLCNQFNNTETLTTTSHTTMIFGAGDGDGLNNFKGKVDDVRVYNRVLSATEAQQLYNYGRTVVTSAHATFLTSGLNNYYTFDGDNINYSNLTMSDEGNSPSTATYVGFATSSLVIPGKVDGAGNFKGGQAIQSNLTSDSIFSNKTFTVNEWFKSGTSTAEALIAKNGGTNGSSGSGGFSIFLNANTSGDISALTKQSSSNNNAFRESATAGFNDGKWHMATEIITTDTSTSGNNSITLYVDGQLNEGSLTVTGVYQTQTDPLGIGARDVLGTLNANKFIGGIDDVRIYSRALTPWEITQLYTAGITTESHTNNPFLTNGLVGSWNMDGSAVNYTTLTQPDQSGNGNGGTYVGIATSSLTIPGVTGTAVPLSANASNYVSYGNHSIWDFGSGDMSISMWAYFKSTPSASGYCYICKLDFTDTGNPHGWSIIGFVSGSPNLDFKGGNGAQEQLSFGTFPSLNQWHYLTFTRASTTLTTYVDGVSKGTLTYSGSLASSCCNMYVGSLNTTQRFADANIDNVRLYNRALSPTEIIQLYAAGL